MLTSDQIDVLRDLSGQIVDPVVEFLIRDIARRIAAAGQITSTAAYQIWRAQNLGVSQKKVMQQVRKLLGASESEMEALLERSAELGHGYDLARFPTAEAVPFAENTALQQVLDATVQMAREDLSNVTQTLGFVTHDGKCEELTRAYEKSCDFAFQKVVTGAQSYTEAIRDAVRGLAEKGIRSIDYESGVHRSLEAAVRGSIMGGLGLMQERISQQNHDDLSCDGWEISAHAASAPDHEPIQGKQYSDEAYTRLNNDLVRRIGTLNCGHSAFPIILGVNSPQYSDEELEELRRANEEGIEYEGKHYTMYEATQRQRSLERAMRSRKRRILIDDATGDKEKLQRDQIRLVRTREEYHRFSKAAGLREQWERAEAAGFSWKHEKTATRETDLKFKEILEKAKNGDKIVLSEDMEHIVAGKSFAEIQPLRGNLSNRAVRRWYNVQDSRIPSQIDPSLSLEEQARQACDLRNQNRTDARDLMRDQKERRRLDAEEPNKTFEELVADKMARKGLSYEEALRDILSTSTKTRKSINKQLGLE